MNHRTLLSCWLLFGLVTAVIAQEPTGQIDLEAVARWAQSRPEFVLVTGVLFVENDAQCMEDKGAVRISGRTLRYIHTTEAVIPFQDDSPLRANSWSNSTTAIDDETYQNRYSTSYCRLDIAVRQQVRRDGFWKSLPVVRHTPPNQSLKRRGVRPLPGESLNEQKAPSLDQKEEREVLRAMGNAGRLLATSGWGFTFDNSPEICLEALGNFRVDRSGFQLSFLLPLSGDLNRFVIQRTELDAERGRLSLTHDNCRWELTVGRLSVRRNGQWVALPLAPN
jgi:hypothetical protein